MDTQTKTKDLGEQLQDAVLQAALDAEQTDSGAVKQINQKRKFGDGTPGPGRPKGVPNAVTRTIREAVEKAAKDCHADGLAGWLVERAMGGIQDRQIFAQMVSKAMPLQVHANVDGGIKLELSWLAGRNIGTTAPEQLEKRSQVIDLEQNDKGEYRIKDPVSGEKPKEN